MTVRRGFHGLLLGQNARSYGVHVDGVILRIIREDLDRFFVCNRMLSPYSVRRNPPREVFSVLLHVSSDTVCFLTLTTTYSFHLVSHTVSRSVTLMRTPETVCRFRCLDMHVLVSLFVFHAFYGGLIAFLQVICRLPPNLLRDVVFPRCIINNYSVFSLLCIMKY